MPLVQGHSSQAFDRNLKAEMNAGKPQKQALAIAYAVKRRNMKAKGGMIEPDNEKLDPTYEDGHPAEALLMREGIEVLPKDKLNHNHIIEQAVEPMEYVSPDKINYSRNMAHGGFMSPKMMAEKIMMKKMASGGMMGEGNKPGTDTEDQDWLSMNHDWLASEPDDDDDPEAYGYGGPVLDNMHPASSQNTPSKYADGGMCYADGGMIDDDMKKKNILSKIMANLSTKHMGK